MTDYTKLKTGDLLIVRVTPSRLAMEGRIVWIHPDRIFFRAEFKTETGERFFECWSMRSTESPLQKDHPVVGLFPASKEEPAGREQE